MLGGEWETYSLVQDKDDTDMLITDDPVLSLNGYVPNEYMAMVFLVQYEIGLPVPKVSHLDPTSMVRVVNPPVRTAFTTVTLGSTIYIPSDGKVIWLKNSARNVSADEGGVDIELKLLKDEISAILSPNVLMSDAETSVAGGDALDASDSKSAKNRLSLKADDKNHRGNDHRGKKHLKEDVDTDPMIGFDLKMFHSVLGEVLHNDNIENLLKMEQKGKEVTGKLNVAPEEAAATEADDDRNDAHERKMDDSPKGGRKSREKDSGRFERLSSSGFSRTRISQSRRGDDDDDQSEIAESIVSGTSEQSNYRLDPSYYYSKRRYAEGSGGGIAARDDGDGPAPASEAITGRLGVPKDRQSLLALSMQSKLGPDSKGGHRGPTDLLEPDKRQGAFYTGEEVKVAPLSKVGVAGNASHVRELTRGAKSRLNRHGFNQVIADSAAPSGASGPGGKNVVVDIELEARDPLSMHEIRIQFAGFRAGSYTVEAKSDGVSPQTLPYCPRSVYASYQFYTCKPTKTEIMRVISSSRPGETCVFVRDDPQSRGDTPLTLRYVIDCSTSSPTEAFEFSEYLAHCSLYVDLWDADSLLLVGTFAVPLRKLLRQGKSVVKHAIECDVINADIGANNQGGISTCVVADGGPVSGSVVGAVQVIISNYGQKGSGKVPLLTDTAISGAADSFNWRAYGVENSAPNSGGPNRPKNCVRARPLSEGAPQLGKVLQEVRGAADHHHGGSSMRSLTATRGAPGACTLTYDEVAVLFKRFQGVSKGTVQYAGDFMTLLDMPSWTVASRKLIKAFELYGSRSVVEKEMLRHSDANSRLDEKDIESFLRVLFDKTRIICRPEDYQLIAARFVAEGQNGVATVPQIMSFCEGESDRQKWAQVSRRFRAAVQSAYIDGEDVEQRLAEHDTNGEHFIGKEKFLQFLEWLSSFGKHITNDDIKLCCRHFSRSPGRDAPAVVSLREFMAFVGKEYVGNLQVRIQKHVQRSGKHNVKAIMGLLDKASGSSSARGPRGGKVQSYSYADVEEMFRELGVFSEISHEQVLSVLKNMDFRKNGKLSLKQILNFLNVEYNAGDLDHRGGEAPLEGGPDMDIEGMLRLLLAKVQSNGIAVDEAFRHFDTNGDGQISIQELEIALTDLCIFAHIPNWKSQIPALVAKFDSSGDNEVSLKEFFQYLGLSSDYAPNIIQKMTNIFAVATQKGLSIKAIFEELDGDGNGQLEVDELLSGLKKIGTFGDISKDDAEAVVAKFDKDGDKKISIDEFVTYFTERVKRAATQRRLRQAEKKTEVMIFRDVMQAAKAKGATAALLFAHMDKDKGGSISLSEFSGVLSGLAGFKELEAKKRDKVISEVFSTIDIDGSGDITLQEFEKFVDGSVANSVATRTKNAEDTFNNRANLIDQVRDVYKTAENRGLSFETAFSLADSDGSGQLTLKELERTLRKLPAFKEVPQSDIKNMFDIIDADHSGQVSIEEFKSFLKHGQVIADPRAEAAAAAAAERERQASNEDTTTEFKTKFIHFTKRILQGDAAFLANLDQDQDGLVELRDLKRAFSKEGMFKNLSEERVEDILEPFRVQRKFIALDELMNFVEGRYNPKTNLRQKERSSDLLGESKEDRGEGRDDPVVREYTFSTNPEIKSLEKKIRGFGKILSKKAVDVEEMFRSLDNRSTGMVTRSQLIEVLCRLGMYVLEQGRTFDHALVPANDTARSQIHQINRLKGTGGDYLHNAPRMARRLLMNGGGSGVGAPNEFSVIA